MACSFGVLAEVYGKTKVIPLPSGGSLFIFPGAHVVVTNLDDPSKQVTLNAAGSFQFIEGPNGELLVLSRGTSLVGHETMGEVVEVGAEVKGKK